MPANDDEESENLSAGRYPVMPSLVGLQQMKNRLTLAMLGKKLMKWTAMAMGRELRKIAAEINVAYMGLSDDIRQGYIALARCRFIEPGFNDMVAQNIPKLAAITLKSVVKPHSGVKIIYYDVFDNDLDSYPNLLLAKSSMEIQKTKKIWRELLLRMITILQLRNSFASVEAAHKSATKRQNVLSKVVIPKTKNSIKYILLELEELAREELYRIKKIKQKKEQRKNKEKMRNKMLNITPEELPVCETVQILDEAIHPEPESEPESEPEPEPEKPSSVQPIDLKEPLSVQSCRAGGLKDTLTHVIQRSNDFMKEHLNVYETKDFLKCCEDLKTKLESVFTCEGNESVVNNKDPSSNIRQNIKTGGKQTITLQSPEESRNYISDAANSRQQIIYTFMAACKEFVTNIQKDLDSSAQMSEDAMVKLRDQLSQAINLSQEAKKSCCMGESFDIFLKSCETVQKRLTQQEQTRKREPQLDIDKLKSHFDQIMVLVRKLKNDGLATDSMESFMNNYKISNYSIDLDKKRSRENKFVCRKSCICKKNSRNETCANCKQSYEPSVESVRSIEKICKTCFGDEFESNSGGTSKGSMRSMEPICKTCFGAGSGSNVTVRKSCDYVGECETAASLSCDSNECCSEKKVKKTVKLVRAKNADGTYKEEKQVVIKTTEKHDKNNKLQHDSSNESRNPENSGTGKKYTSYCLMIDNNYTGPKPYYVRKTKSDSTYKTCSLGEPLLRQCLSFETNQNRTIENNEATADSPEFSSLISYSENTLYS